MSVERADNFANVRQEGITMPALSEKRWQDAFARSVLTEQFEAPFEGVDLPVAAEAPIAPPAPKVPTPPPAPMARFGDDNYKIAAVLLHNVDRGQTLASIARDAGISVKFLMRENAKLASIAPNALLKARTEVRIPMELPVKAPSPATEQIQAQSPAVAKQEKPVTPQPKVADQPEKLETVECLEVGHVIELHTVKKGETLESIAAEAGVSIDCLHKIDDMANQPFLKSLQRGLAEGNFVRVPVKHGPQDSAPHNQGVNTSQTSTPADAPAPVDPNATKNEKKPSKVWLMAGGGLGSADQNSLPTQFHSRGSAPWGTHLITVGQPYSSETPGKTLTFVNTQQLLKAGNHKVSLQERASNINFGKPGTELDTELSKVSVGLKYENGPIAVGYARGIRRSHEDLSKNIYGVQTDVLSAEFSVKDRKVFNLNVNKASLEVRVNHMTGEQVDPKLPVGSPRNTSVYRGTLIGRYDVDFPKGVNLTGRIDLTPSQTGFSSENFIGIPAKSLSNKRTATEVKIGAQVKPNDKNKMALSGVFVGLGFTILPKAKKDPVKSN